MKTITINWKPFGVRLDLTIFNLITWPIQYWYKFHLSGGRLQYSLLVCWMCYSFAWSMDAIHRRPNQRLFSSISTGTVSKVLVWNFQSNVFDASLGHFIKLKKLKMALTIILSCGVIFLVLSLVGTCGANMKNEILLSLYTITMSILWTCEIVVTFRSVSTLNWVAWKNIETKSWNHILVFCQRKGKR